MNWLTLKKLSIGHPELNSFWPPLPPTLPILSYPFPTQAATAILAKRVTSITGATPNWSTGTRDKS